MKAIRSLLRAAPLSRALVICFATAASLPLLLAIVGLSSNSVRLNRLANASTFASGVTSSIALAAAALAVVVTLDRDSGRQRAAEKAWLGMLQLRHSIESLAEITVLQVKRTGVEAGNTEVSVEGLHLLAYALEYFVESVRTARESGALFALDASGAGDGDRQWGLHCLILAAHAEQDLATRHIGIGEHWLKVPTELQPPGYIWVLDGVRTAMESTTEEDIRALWLGPVEPWRA